MTMIAMSPACAAWPIISRTPADSGTPRAAVGSSRSSRRPAPERGLADGDDLALAAGHRVDRARRGSGNSSRQPGDGLSRGPLHVALAQDAEAGPAAPAADELAARGTGSPSGRRSRRGRGPGRRSRRRPRAPRPGFRTRGCVPARWIAPPLGTEDAGDALDEGRLAGAVVADEPDDLAAAQLEADVHERLDRAVAC